MKKQLYCITCGKPRDAGRRRCRNCSLLYRREEAKERYKKNGRYTYDNVCIACGNDYKAWRKSQEFCSSCWRLAQKLSITEKNPYIYDSEYFKSKRKLHEHRRIAEEALGRDLKTSEFVHHMDCNSKNNDVNNLILISRKMHGRLHLFLRKQRVIFEKSKNENFVNCWKALIVPQTTAWLETAGVKVLKLWELGNQQPST